ncbi:acetoin reductase [Floricoccus penangensis]|uniref:acetoin reductase n=1 Tax=Floricoccus penangensis TaxID=1859475 RepID=UPI00203E98EC|nr:acetoin reductase [Floricoccus penangensis]URZ87664.1 acetoin reductase [Floricoccus penangensis]
MFNKVAIITGAARGIGKGIAKQLVQDGYDVVIADYDLKTAQETAEELKSKGYKAIAVQGDVSDAQAHKDFVKAAVDNFGRLDTYVNNAGLCQVESIPNINKESLDKLFGTNVYGTVFGMQAAYEQFIKQDDGDKIRKIINASSISGHQAYDMLATYSATKFAIRAYTQAAAKEFAKDNITVNSYCPGIVLTPMYEQIEEEMSNITGAEIGEFLENFTETVTLKRPSTAKDVANFVSYLASDKSDYMTGQSVLIDGGIQFN